MGEAGPSGEPGIPVRIPRICTHRECVLNQAAKLGLSALLPCPNKALSSATGAALPAEVEAQQGRQRDLGGWGRGAGSLGSKEPEIPNIFQLCSGLGRVDSWLLSGTADFGVIARAMSVFLGTEVCRDPEEQQ